jgi:hypothetical protein
MIANKRRFSFSVADDCINSRDFKAGCDQFPQPTLDYGNEVRIVPTHWNSISNHFWEVVDRERQARNPAYIDMKCGLLTQFHGPRFAHEKILARALRAVVVGPGCGVKDDCKVCIALTAGRGTQNNVR